MMSICLLPSNLLPNPREFFGSLGITVEIPEGRPDEDKKDRQEARVSGDAFHGMDGLKRMNLKT